MVKNPNLSEEELVGRSIKAINTLLNKYQLRECFHKDDKCSSKIIEAHSIQRNRVLKNISDDGHIMMFQMITNNKEAKWKPEERGLNKATVFSGFCEYHDREIFKPIDLYDYEEDNEEQEFLFAYRALAKEHHIKLSITKAYENILKWTKQKNYEQPKNLISLKRNKI